MKRVLLTGAAGFVGSALGAALAARGDEVIAVSRARSSPLSFRTVGWDLAGVGDVDAVVHLAGESVAQRWTSGARARIVRSRVDGLAKLRSVKAPVLVSASAIGYYGDRGDEPLPETAPAGRGFLADVCVAWERAALELGVARTCILRLGMVLGPGGALEKMVTPFRIGVGGRIGNGQQWVSWIHRDDVVALLLRAIDRDSMKGIYNAVAPQPARNEELSDALADALGTRARLPAPGFALRVALGEMASMLLDSQRVVPARLIDEGFSWRYPSIFEALRAALETLAF